MSEPQISQQSRLYNFLNEWENEDGIKVQTSGSTGVPKEINLKKEILVNSAKRTIKHFGINKHSRLHSSVSFEYIGGKMMIVRSLVSGCQLTFSEPSQRPQPPEGKNKVDLISIVPAQMPYILEHLDDYKIVKNFLLGGSAIDSRLWNRIVESGITAWESYGMTETASHIALRRITGSASSRPRFVPLPGIKIRMDFDDRLHIYDGANFFTTNDVGKVYKDGSFEVLGRKDDIIISGGIKMNPLVIEDKLNPYLEEELETFFITSLPDEQWTSRIILVGTPYDKENVGENNIERKIENIIKTIPSSILPNRERPKEIRIIEEIPRTSNDKIIRKLKI